MTAVSLGLTVIGVPAYDNPAAAAPGVAAAMRGSSVRNQIVPIAGDAELLVFGTSRSDRQLGNDPPGRHTVLHVLTKAGHQRTLGNTGARAAWVAVAGPVVEVFEDGNNLRWWKVTSHRHGSLTLDRQETYVGATPTGFVYQEQEGDTHLIEQTFSGKTTDLGDPLDPDQVYSVVTATHGLLAYQSDTDVGNRQIAYMRWSRPGAFHQLPKFRNDYSPNCSALGATYAVCNDELVPLNGARRIVPPKPTVCYGGAVILHHSAVWICHGGRPHQLTASGHLHSARRRYDALRAVTAFGRLVFASKTESKLLTLTSLNAKPELELKAAPPKSAA